MSDTPLEAKSPTQMPPRIKGNRECRFTNTVQPKDTQARSGSTVSTDGVQ